MNGEICQKYDRRAVHRFILSLVLLCLLTCMTACQDTQVQGECNNPYSTAEIQRMMSYHGSLVARFDGKQWWILTGNEWARIENAGALEYAQFASDTTSPAL